MKLTNAQKNELVVWEYFIPTNVKWNEKTEEDLKKFFEWSERGLHKEEAENRLPKVKNRTYFEALVEGKRWAGIHVGMYEEAILDKIAPIGYWSLWGGGDIIEERKWYQFWRPKFTFKMDNLTPRPVVDYMKKEMFKGTDAEIMEECYRELLEDIELKKKKGRRWNAVLRCCGRLWRVW